MGLQVIGAGLGRTGTASLKVALEKLGLGRCYHMSEVLAKPEDMGHWIDAAGGSPDWDRLFADFGATVDFPACIYWRELTDYYPAAKVVLSVRDPERWYRSTQETILSPRFWNFTKGGPFGAMCEQTIERFFGGEMHDRDHLIAAFNRHVEAVKRDIPPERLLVFEAKQGWAPLCEFLEVPAPAEPFPHVNSEEETKVLIEKIMASAQDGGIGDQAFHGANEEFSSDPK